MFSLYVADRAMGKEKRPRGAMISLFFLLYFSGRFTVEFFKSRHTLPETSTFTMGQYLSMPCILLGAIGLAVSFKKRVPVGGPRRFPPPKKARGVARRSGAARCQKSVLEPTEAYLPRTMCTTWRPDGLIIPSYI